MSFPNQIEKSGTLYITRLNFNGDILKSERRRHVTLLKHPFRFAYYADSEMMELLGTIELRYAKLGNNGELLDNGIILQDFNMEKILKISDKKGQANIMEWFFIIQNALSHSIHSPSKYPMIPSDIQGAYVCNMTVHSSRRDEITHVVEYGIWCHITFLSKRLNKRSQTRWISWRTLDEFKSLDMQLRHTLGWQMEEIEFPRERKRDALLGGSKSKMVQESRVQILNEYLQKILKIPYIDEFHKHHGNLDLKEFIEFDLRFGQDSFNPKLVKKEIDLKTNAEGNENKMTKKGSKMSENKTKNPSDKEQSKILENSQEDSNLTNISIKSTEDSSLELVTGIEAESLNNAIIQAISDACHNDISRIKLFKVQTRMFGEGNTHASQYFQFISDTYGFEFALWIVKDIVHLVPDLEKRKELYEACINAQKIENSSPVSNTSISDGTISPSSSSVLPTNASDSIEIPIEVEPENDPTKAHELHQEILDQVYELFNQDMERVEDFQDQTKSYGKNEITASEYVAYLCGAVGSESAKHLTLKMVRLLPDSIKRHDLLSSLHKAVSRAMRRKKKRSKQYSSDSISNTSRPMSTPIVPVIDSMKNSNEINTTDLQNPPSLQDHFEKSLKLHDEATKQRRQIKSRNQVKSSPGILYSNSETFTKTHVNSSKEDEEAIHNRTESTSYSDQMIINMNDTKVSIEEENNEEKLQVRDEENPVLARLRKQGAVDFLGTLKR